MTVKQALKEKNKLTKLINTLVVRLHKYNSVEEGAIRTYSPKEDLEKLQNSVSDLALLKTRIHEANVKVYHQIFRLSELKGLVKQLRGIDCTEGVTTENRRFGDSSTVTKTVEVGQKEMDNLILYYEEEIERIQEELDIHNATTHI